MKILLHVTCFFVEESFPNAAKCGFVRVSLIYMERNPSVSACCSHSWCMKAVKAYVLGHIRVLVDDGKGSSW